MFSFSDPGVSLLVVLIIVLTICGRDSFSIHGTKQEKFRRAAPAHQGGDIGLETFPYMCSVHYSGRRGFDIYVGACSLFDPSWVLTSIDNLNRPVDWDKPYEEWFHNVKGALRVQAGVNRMTVNESFRSFRLQTLTVDKLYVPLSPQVVRVDGPKTELSKLISNDTANITKDVQQSVFGCALNIGFLKLLSRFEWGDFVLPIPILTGYNQQGVTIDMDVVARKTIDVKKALEIDPYSQLPCYVPSWQLFGWNLLQYHRVVYVPDIDCMEAFCAYSTAACLAFPMQEYHMCFRSLTLADVCDSDRGSSLVCQWFEDSVLAVLSNAFNCGFENLPAVYTSIDAVVKLFYVITSRPPDPRPYNIAFPTLPWPTLPV